MSGMMVAEDGSRLMQPNLVNLWHFDEADGPVALSSATSGKPMYVYAGRRTSRRFGSALVLNTPGAYARGEAPGRLVEGTVCFWLRLSGGESQVDILDIQGALQIMVDNTGDNGLLAVLGEDVLSGGKSIEQGKWLHVVITFAFDGTRLYLDGRLVSEKREAKHGLAAGPNRQDITLVGPIQNPSVEIAIDELAIYNRPLSEQEIVQLVLGGFEMSDPVRAAPPARVIDASRYVDPSDSTGGLQKAIDALGPSGGTVNIGPGRYVLRRSLQLYTGVTLRGESGQAVLTIPKPEGSRLMLNVPAGADSVEVEDPSIFSIGDEVTIVGPEQRGWDTTHAVVRDIEGRILWLSRALAQDYVAKHGTMVCRWHPAITALHHHNVTIENITIDATPAPISEGFSQVEFCCSAIHLVSCADSCVSKCRVTGWPHDGISVQGGRNVTVQDCVVRNCLGHGLHPGTSTRYSKWIGNVSTYNGFDGLYVCAEVEHSLMRGNLLVGNGRHGIGGVGNGEDRFNVISENQCLDNAQGGIVLNGGGGNSVLNNVCRDNSRRAPGRWPGILLSNTKQSIISGNLCVSDPDMPSQMVGIQAKVDATENIIRDNVCQGCSVKLETEQSEASNVTEQRQRPRLRRFPNLDQF